MDINEGGDALLRLIVVGVAVVIALGIAYTNLANSHTQISYIANQSTVYNLQPSAISANAVNDIAANQLTLAISGPGGTSWISSANSITVTVTGDAISSYASNTIYATPASSNTQTFTLDYYSGTNTLCATCGNFYNITSVGVSGGNNGGAVPGLKFTVTQSYGAATHGSAPWANTVNSISINLAFNVSNSKGASANFTTNAGNVANTSGTSGNYTYYILFAALVLAVVIGVFARKQLERG